MRKTWNAAAPIRMLTVTLSGLSDPEDARQLSLFDDADGEARDERLYHAVDAIRQRYGANALKPAIFAHAIVQRGRSHSIEPFVEEVISCESW